MITILFIFKAQHSRRRSVNRHKLRQPENKTKNQEVTKNEIGVNSRKGSGGGKEKSGIESKEFGIYKAQR